MLCSSGKDAIDGGVRRIGRSTISQKNPNPNRAFGSGPGSNGIDHSGIGRIDRLDQPKPDRVGGKDLERIARVVAVHAKGRNEDRTVDPDGIHGGYHLLAGDLGWSRQGADPRAARVVTFVSVNLGIQYWHCGLQEAIFLATILPLL